jgi:hypothetical protein
MDGISAAASIWALVEGTGALVKCLKGMKNAHSDQVSLGRELSVLYGLLWKVAALDHSATQPDSLTSGVDRAAFAEYEEVLVKLHAKIRPHVASIGASISWPFRKEDVKDMLLKIERLKTAITLSLGAQTLYVIFLAHDMTGN